MTTFSKKLDWYLVGGLVLGAWATANTYLDISRYGFNQGVYWWFCNLALIGVSVALSFKIRDHLIGWLSIACFTQVFWMIDNIFRVVTKRNLFGLVEFMYQPGLPIDEFVLSHYHYFTIPVSIMALIHLPKRPTNYAWAWVATVNPLIFAISYFVFPAHQNVNCIHEPCFPSLVGLAGPAYSISFWAFVYTAHLLICWGLMRLADSGSLERPLKRIAAPAFATILIASVALAAYDTTYKMSLPSMKCAGTTDLSGLGVKCNYTLDYQPGVMLLSYTAINNSDENRICTTKATVEGRDYPLHTQVDLASHEKRILTIPVPYPVRNIVMTLSASCQNQLRLPANKE